MEYRGRGYKTTPSSSTSAPSHRLLLVSRGGNANAHVHGATGRFAAAAASGGGRGRHADKDDDDEGGSSSDSSTSVLVPTSSIPRKKKKKRTGANDNNNAVASALHSLPPLLSTGMKTAEASTPKSSKQAPPPSSNPMSKSAKSSDSATNNNVPTVSTAATAKSPKSGKSSGKKSTSKSSGKSTARDELASASVAVAVASSSKTSSPGRGVGGERGSGGVSKLGKSGRLLAASSADGSNNDNNNNMKPKNLMGRTSSHHDNNGMEEEIISPPSPAKKSKKRKKKNSMVEQEGQEEEEQVHPSAAATAAVNHEDVGNFKKKKNILNSNSNYHGEEEVLDDAKPSATTSRKSKKEENGRKTKSSEHKSEEGGEEVAVTTNPPSKSRSKRSKKSSIYEEDIACEEQPPMEMEDEAMMPSSSKKKKQAPKSSKKRGSKQEEEEVNVPQQQEQKAAAESSSRARYQDGETLLAAMRNFGALAPVDGAAVAQQQQEAAATLLSNSSKKKKKQKTSSNNANEEKQVKNVTNPPNSSSSKSKKSQKSNNHYDINNSNSSNIPHEEFQEEDVDAYYPCEIFQGDADVDVDDVERPEIQLDDDEQNAITQKIQYQGVTFRSRRRKFQARLYRGCREHNLGLFDLAADAALAYDVALRICDAGTPKEEEEEEDAEGGGEGELVGFGGSGDNAVRGEGGRSRREMDDDEGTEEEEEEEGPKNHPINLFGKLAANFLSGGMLIGDNGSSKHQNAEDNDEDNSRVEDEDAVIYALDWLNPSLKHDTPLAQRMNARASEFNFLLPSEFRKARAEEIEDLRLGRGLYQDFGDEVDDDVEPVRPEDLPDEKGLVLRIKKEIMRLAEGYSEEAPKKRDMVLPGRFRTTEPLDSDNDDNENEAMDEEDDDDVDEEENENSDGSDESISRKISGSSRNSSHWAKKRTDWDSEMECTARRAEDSVPEEEDDECREEQANALLSLTSEHKKRVNETKKQELAQKLSAIMKGGASPSQLSSSQSQPSFSLQASYAAARLQEEGATPSAVGPDRTGVEGTAGASSGQGGEDQNNEPITSSAAVVPQGMIQLVQLQQERILEQQHQQERMTQQRQRTLEQQCQQQQSQLSEQPQQQQSEQGQSTMSTARGLATLGLTANDVTNLLNLVNTGVISVDQLQQLITSHQVGMVNPTNENNDVARDRATHGQRRNMPAEVVQSAPIARASGNGSVNNRDRKKEPEKKLETPDQRAASYAARHVAQDRTTQNSIRSNPSNGANTSAAVTATGLLGFNGPFPPNVIEQLTRAAIEQQGDKGRSNNGSVGEIDANTDEVQALLQKQKANEAKKAALAEKLSALMGGGSGRQSTNSTERNSTTPRNDATRASSNNTGIQPEEGRSARQPSRTNTPRSLASHDSAQVSAQDHARTNMRRSNDNSISRENAIRALNDRIGASVSARTEERVTNDRANVSSETPQSSTGSVNRGGGAGVRAEPRTNQNQQRGPDLPTSNNGVARAAAQGASTPTNAPPPGATSFPRELQAQFQALQAAGLPSNINEEALRNLLLKKHVEEMNKQALEARLRGIMGGDQQSGTPQQDRNSDAASLISRQLRQIDEDQERNLLQSLLQENGSSTNNVQNQADSVQQALLQNLLSNQQQRETPHSASENQHGSNPTNPINADVFCRRLAIESMLLSQESRLDSLRENLVLVHDLEQSGALQQMSQLTQLNQLNAAIASASIPRELLINQESAIAQEMRNASVAERLLQGSAGENFILGNLGLDGAARNNQLSALQQLMSLQQPPQLALGGLPQNAGISQEVLLALASGGGGGIGGVGAVNALNLGNNQNMNPLVLLQASLQQGQGNNNNNELCQLAHLLGLGQGNGPDRVESNNMFQRRTNGDS